MDNTETHTIRFKRRMTSEGREFFFINELRVGREHFLRIHALAWAEHADRSISGNTIYDGVGEQYTSTFRDTYVIADKDRFDITEPGKKKSILTKFLTWLDGYSTLWK